MKYRSSLLCVRARAPGSFGQRRSVLIVGSSPGQNCLGSSYQNCCRPTRSFSRPRSTSSTARIETRAVLCLVQFDPHAHLDEAQARGAGQDRAWHLSRRHGGAQVGQLLKKLDDLDIANNTIVIYTTDNGAETRCPASSLAMASPSKKSLRAQSASAPTWLARAGAGFGSKAFLTRPTSYLSTRGQSPPTCCGSTVGTHAASAWSAMPRWDTGRR